MLSADLADTPLASYRPDVASELDSLSDRLREIVAPFVPAGVQARVFAAMDDAIDEQPSGSGEFSREQVLVEGLRAIYRDTSHERSVRIIAVAALKRLGKDGRSYQAIGDEFGVTRACPHGHSRRIERNTGLRCRSDKSEQAREISTDRATGRRRLSNGTRTAGEIRKPTAFRSVFSIFRIRGI